MTKYHAIRTVVDGITFASKAEAARYGQLKLLQREHHIDDLKLQPKYKIVVNGKRICTYIADFEYWDCDKAAWVTEDVKGVATPVYRLKKKLVAALFNVEIVEVRAA